MTPNPAPDAVSDVSVRRGALHLLLNYVKTGGGNPASVVTNALRELEAAISSPAPATEAQAPAALDFEAAREIAAKCVDHARGICLNKIFVDCTDDLVAFIAQQLASSSAERSALEKRVGELESELQAWFVQAQKQCDRAVAAESVLAAARQRGAEAMREAR